MEKMFTCMFVSEMASNVNYGAPVVVPGAPANYAYPMGDASNTMYSEEEDDAAEMYAQPYPPQAQPYPYPPPMSYQPPQAQPYPPTTMYPPTQQQPKPSYPPGQQQPSYQPSQPYLQQQQQQPFYPLPSPQAYASQYQLYDAQSSGGSGGGVYMPQTLPYPPAVDIEEAMQDPALVYASTLNAGQGVATASKFATIQTKLNEVLQFVRGQQQQQQMVAPPLMLQPNTLAYAAAPQAPQPSQPSQPSTTTTTTKALAPLRMSTPGGGYFQNMSLAEQQATAQEWIKQDAAAKLAATGKLPDKPMNVKVIMDAYKTTYVGSSEAGKPQMPVDIAYTALVTGAYPTPSVAPYESYNPTPAAAYPDTIKQQVENALKYPGAAPGVYYPPPPSPPSPSPPASVPTYSPSSNQQPAAVASPAAPAQVPAACVEYAKIHAAYLNANSGSNKTRLYNTIDADCAKGPNFWGQSPENFGNCMSKVGIQGAAALGQVCDVVKRAQTAAAQQPQPIGVDASPFAASSSPASPSPPPPTAVAQPAYDAAAAGTVSSAMVPAEVMAAQYAAQTAPTVKALAKNKKNKPLPPQCADPMFYCKDASSFRTCIAKPMKLKATREQFRQCDVPIATMKASAALAKSKKNGVAGKKKLM